MTFEQMLTYLATGGSVVVVSWFVSWALEKQAWWRSITSELRSLVILGISLLIGVGATWLAMQPDVLGIVRPYATGALLVITSWLGTQTAHKLDVKK